MPTARRRPSDSARRARRAGRRNTRSDLGARVLVAIPAIVFALYIVISGGLVFTVGLIALGCICLHELYEMLAPTRPVRLAGFLSLAAILIAADFGDQFHVLLAAVATVPVLFMLAATGPRQEHATLAMAVTLFGVWWIGLALGHAVLLRELDHGRDIVINVLVGTFIGDTGAYLGGRMFGRRQLAPRISPSKTSEGLFIGMLFAVLGVWFAGLYEDWLTGVDALVLGAAIAVAAPIGDLFESFVKRDVGTKDTGKLFGAHGGALDRLDAVFFTAVVGYYVWYAML